ncbi:putative structural protein [Pseudomonas phage tabernarius]|uniref:Putative structural protein n=1 Tax=Pseudomonas phage tabernarius TaxID=2048978 RepID=A0A2H4P6S9_9CAUD|nr:minor head protein [Pseudomonas phage tabernarius]ATW57879.1 putative structural protein [Pseudomonas phage tabernarius]
MRILPFGRKKDRQEAEKKASEQAIQLRGEFDPLDTRSRSVSSRGEDWPEDKEDKGPTLLTVDNFPVYHKPKEIGGKGTFSRGVAMDEASYKSLALDDAETGAGSLKASAMSNYQVPEALQQWYNSQGFIGYQACALIAQHWLVDKACSMAPNDAVRNGWELKADGVDLDEETVKAFRELDKSMKVKENLAELARFKNIFGIRIAIFEVESDDPDYYEKPFNIDGVTEGSYKGISQIDPYWMTPLMTAASTSNPAAINFYDPEYWVISGKKYHRSHLVICRGPQPADILKPTYIFGGIPLTQRIYERVYAAERTANEAPLLALNKRTTAIHLDVEKAMANEGNFVKRLLFWVKHRDNYGVKVLGKDEVMEQFDTNLADFDSVIMNQYQLVAAIAKTPATKMLGTSPKGFNATGEFETVSYHEELESIQEHDYDPMLERHYLIANKHLGYNVSLEIVWQPVDSIGAVQRAALNLTKAQTDEINVNLGAVSPDDVRERIKEDRHSSYNSLTDEKASPEMGMSPENLAALEKAGAEQKKGDADLTQAGDPQGPQAQTEPDAPGSTQKPALAPAEAPAKPQQANPLAATVEQVQQAIEAVSDALMPEGESDGFDALSGIQRTVKPSVTGIDATVGGIHNVIPQMPESDMPKIKLNGIVTCIENPRGTVRRGKNGDWAIKMPHHYGYVKGTQGADGDAVDCFVGPNLKSKNVYVVNQLKQDGSFDEHKCMMGFDSQEEAEAGYNASYSEGWTGKGPVTAMNINDFRRWVRSPKATKPTVDGL